MGGLGVGPAGGGGLLVSMLLHLRLLAEDHLHRHFPVEGENLQTDFRS